MTLKTPPEVATEEAHDALLNENDLWMPHTRELASALGLSGAVSRFATGSGPVLGVGTTHVVKWVADLYVDEVASEVLGLGAAEGKLDIATPDLVDVRRVGTWTAITMTRVLGKSWFDVKPSLAAQSEAAKAVGASLKTLHGLAMPPCPRKVNWPGFVAERLANAQDDQRRRGLAPHLVEEIPEFLSRTGIAEVAQHDVRLLHADLHHHHVMLDDNGVVTGWIDFADCFVGAPAYEMLAPGVYLAQGEAAVVRGLLDGYGDPNLRGKSASWWLAMTLLHRFAHLQWYTQMLGLAEAPKNLDAFAERLWPV